MKTEQNLLSANPALILLNRYEDYLRQEERSFNTISKYVRDLRAFFSYQGELPLTKDLVLRWKETLMSSYAPASVNSMLAAVNGFLNWIGRPECRVKPLKIQRELFSEPEKELTQKEYARLVRVAGKKGKERLSAVIQTICVTGIRVSELQYVTVEAVRSGRAEVNCKGKRRTVFLPDRLRSLLNRYVRDQKRTAGPVFVTRTGKPLDRSNIWRDMKALCEEAGVAQRKVFPHNLRHLFARTYYTLEKDLSRLADILGHSNINTTRIYTAESGTVHAMQIDRMGLVIT